MSTKSQVTSNRRFSHEIVLASTLCSRYHWASTSQEPRKRQITKLPLRFFLEPTNGIREMDHVSYAALSVIDLEERGADRA